MLYVSDGSQWLRMEHSLASRHQLLRKACPCLSISTDYQCLGCPWNDHSNDCKECHGQGWIPDVTLAKLMALIPVEQLSSKGAVPSQPGPIVSNGDEGLLEVYSALAKLLTMAVSGFSVAPAKN